MGSVYDRSLDLKILVMGAGAVGGYFGGMLANCDEDVIFLARGAHLAAINERGLRVESDTSGHFIVHPIAKEKPEIAWKADLVLFCVKSYHNGSAIEAISSAISDSTTILTLQNGIGSGEQLADAFGREKVLLGAAYIDAKRKAPGVIAQFGNTCYFVFGEENGRKTVRANRVQSTFQRSGVDVNLSTNVLKNLWDKLIFICALSGMSCVTRASISEVLDTSETLDLTWQVIREAADSARGMGIDLDENIVESTMAHLQEIKQHAISSMYLDMEAGNPLEISVLNGAVCKIGQQVGVATPVNGFITACLAVADRKARLLLNSFN